MKKIILISLLLFSSNSFAIEKFENNPYPYLKDIRILDYPTGLSIDNYPCEDYEFIDGWLVDDFVCTYKVSSTDIIEFNSDPYTKLVGHITRYILIDKQDTKSFVKKMIEKYGKPNRRHQPDTNSPVENIAWGNLHPQSQQKREFFLVRDGSVGLRLMFSDCAWLTFSCTRFGLSTEQIQSSNVRIAYLLLMNPDIRGLNSDALSQQKDPRIKKVIPEVKTQDTDLIDF